MTRAALLTATLILPGLLAAQTQVHVTGGWRAAYERSRTRIPTDTTDVDGFALAGEATATLGRFGVRARYGQGNVRQSTEGELLVGVHAAPWLALWVGPHARFYRSDGTKVRWLLWEARAHARGSVFAERLTSFLETWRALDGSAVNVEGRFVSAVGAEGGLEFRMPARSLTWRLSYRIEHARISGPERRETTESLALGIVLVLFN